MTFRTVIGVAAGGLPAAASGFRIVDGMESCGEVLILPSSFMACGKEQFSTRMTRSTALPYVPSPKSYQRFSSLKTLKLGEVSERKGERYMS